MIKWCAYCQEFQGEIAPFDQFGLTHGICPGCQKRGLNLSEENFEFIQSLKELQERLWAAGKQGSIGPVVALIDEATRYNLRPVDVLIGLLAPLLYQIGEDWACGKITVADEHRFTAFAIEVLQLVETKMPLAPVGDRDSEIQVLLVNADGNYHSLGVKILEIFLRSAGIATKAVFPGLPPSEIAKLYAELKPKWLGISVSLADQVPAIYQTVKAVTKLSPAGSNDIILGGYAVKTGLVPKIAGTLQTPDLGSLVAHFRQATNT